MKYKNFEPEIAGSVINLGVDVIGEVVLEEKVNLWFNATVRGDMAKVLIK